MTKENIAGNMAEELKKAEETWKEFPLLFENGLLNGAVSRLYYFLLSRVRALLLTRGFEPKSHEGVLGVFSLHLVKQGPLAADSSHLFARLMKYREEADCNPSYTFTTEDVAKFKEGATELARRIKAHLQESGYLGK